MYLRATYGYIRVQILVEIVAMACILWIVHFIVFSYNYA